MIVEDRLWRWPTQFKLVAHFLDLCRLFFHRCSKRFNFLLLPRRSRLEPGSGQEAFLPELSSSFSDLYCEGSTHRGQTDKGK